MGNFSLYGILISIGLFFAIVAFLMTQLNVTNPISGNETSVFQLVISWIL